MSRWRPFPSFSWDLRACGRHGHATYAPDEPELRERLQRRDRRRRGLALPALRRLRARPAARPAGRPTDAPVVLRGRALRDAFVLRLLAVERAVRGVLLVVLAYGLHRFQGARARCRRSSPRTCRC